MADRARGSVASGAPRGVVSVRVVALLSALLFLVVSREAHAARCGPDAHAWVARCAATASIAMHLESCPASVAIVAIEPQLGPPLRVEVSTSTNAFRRVGGHALAPIGDFPDWKNEPEATRRAFEALAACAEKEAPDALVAADAPPPITSGEHARAPRPPLLLLGALLASIAALAMRRPRARVVGLALVAVVATFFLRRLVQPAGYFHQNGQGPLWIEWAVRGDAGEYGPGYVDVFGWLAARVRRPDRAVFVVQELLAAAVPIAGYAIVRRARGAPVVALVAGLVLALDPLLARTGRSESYLATMTTLLFAATAALVLTDLRRWTSTRVLGLVAAGLLVAQAARIHPLAWVACATVPWALAVRPGRPARRFAHSAVASLAIAAIAAPCVLSSMLATLMGEVAGRFMPNIRAILAREALPALLMVGFVAALAAVPSMRRVASRVAVLVAIVALAVVSNVTRQDAPAYALSYAHLFLPSAIAALAAALSFSPPRIVALGVGLLALVHGVLERPSTVMATDAREQAFCMEWRETLPPGAQVAAVQRASDRVLALPLTGVGLMRAVSIEAAAPRVAPGAYYYRSSLCATPEGAPLCTAFEQQHTLRLMSSRQLPAIPSTPWLPLPDREIEVGLYLVER